MKIFVRDVTRRGTHTSAFLLRQGKRMLRFLRFSAGTELEIVLLSGRGMQKLNRKWRKNNSPTTVLSFGVPKGFFGKGFLGEIFLSPEKIKKEAAASGTPFRKELTRYLLHGILHLGGYRDGAARDARTMERIERRTMRKLYGRKNYLRH